MQHWDELMALKQKIGIGDDFRPTIHHPLRPKVMTDRQYVKSFIFENMTPQDERFLRQKFHLNRTDSIDANLQQQLTTSMRVDLFFKTAECRLLPDDDGVHVALTAGNRKVAQAHVGLRFDTEEYAAVLLGLEVPLKAAVPTNTELTVRLGKRIMARGELTIHPRSFIRPSLSFTYRRNDIDFYVDGDRDYSVLYNQFQAEAVPISNEYRNFSFQMGLRWDFMHYSSKLASETSTNVTLNNKHYISYRARINYNSEDNWYFPTRGARVKAEYAYLTDNLVKLDGMVGLSDISASWRKSFTFGKRFTLQPMAYGRLLLGKSVPFIFANTIGGNWFGHYIEQQMPFAGIGNVEFVADQFVAVQLQGQFRIATNNYVLLRVAVAQQAEKLKELFDHKTLYGIQGAYYYKTMFGPLGATFGYSNRTKKPYFFLDLGYEF